MATRCQKPRDTISLIAMEFVDLGSYIINLEKITWIGLVGNKCDVYFADKNHSISLDEDQTRKFVEYLKGHADFNKPRDQSS